MAFALEDTLFCRIFALTRIHLQTSTFFHFNSNTVGSISLKLEHGLLNRIKMNFNLSFCNLLKLCDRRKSTSSFHPRREGGGGVLNPFSHGEAPPRGPTTYPLTETPFVYLLLTNGTPFPIPCLEFCIPFNCCKCTVI